MLQRSDLVYSYDGTIEGFYSCVFESYEKKEIPLCIQPCLEEQLALYQDKFIETDTKKAIRVREGILKKASSTALYLIETGFLTCHPKKELLIFDFVRLALKVGKKAVYLLTDDCVNALQKAVKALTMEAHHFKGFIRFSVSDKMLSSVIAPKNDVLPLLAPHFCDRYPNETFLIYDETHQKALMYHNRQRVFFPLLDYTPPPPGEEEIKFRSLWRMFYNTIAIEERFNPLCRMTHMPKRYWEHLTELNQDKGEGKESLPRNNLLLP